MSTLVYTHDRAGNSRLMTFTITADAPHGGIGENGVGSATLLPDGVIANPSGAATLPDGSAYRLAASRPNTDPAPVTYRMTIYQDNLPISVVTFPGLETSVGVVNVVELLKRARGLASGTTGTAPPPTTTPPPTGGGTTTPPPPSGPPDTGVY